MPPYLSVLSSPVVVTGYARMLGPLSKDCEVTTRRNLCTWMNVHLLPVP